MMITRDDLHPGARIPFQSGRAITPHTEHLTVVWLDGANIHYRKDSDHTKVDQTTIDRFLEIVNSASPREAS